jgi:hypothetical protein
MFQIFQLNLHAVRTFNVPRAIHLDYYTSENGKNRNISFQNSVPVAKYHYTKPCDLSYYSGFRLPYRTYLVAPLAFLITSRHGPSRKHRFQQYLYCWVSIRSNGCTRYTNLNYCKASVPLFSNGRSCTDPIRRPVIKRSALIVGVSQMGLHLLMRVLCK